VLRPAAGTNTNTAVAAGTTETNAVAAAESTNGVNVASATTNATERPLVSRFDADLYNQLLRQMTTLRAREIEMMSTFTATSAPVVQVRNQIAELNKLLVEMQPPAPEGQVADPRIIQIAAPMQMQPLPPSRVPAITARLQTLREQLQAALDNNKRIEASENNIRQLERRKELDESNYKYFSAAYEQAKIDNGLGTEMLNNITVIQSPSIASRTAKDQVKVVAAGGVPVCLVLLYAFVFELLIPRAFVRPKDVETALKLPLIGVVPVLAINGAMKRKMKKQLQNGEDHALVKGTNGNHLEIAPWDESDPMLPYYEALRDRVVMSYEGDPHKPKIVGLTSCNKGAGVSRLSTGLAAALSRDVERDVLYIGLEKNKVALTAFSKGRPTAVEASTSQPAEDWTEQSIQPVRENLMSLATTGRNLVGASAVQSFCDLIPRLKGCNYDYIIFDLPPLSQTSGSLRLASQMERTLLVVESDVTSREKTERAAKLLSNAHANVSVVLNKARNYGPSETEEEL
jgi:Mrp family chromosome partitioning ATPase